MYKKGLDFIGWKSNDDLLTVTDVHERKGHNTYYRIVCHICSLDTELFPLGYFVASKSHLLSGNKPCGCSKSPKWNSDQYLIRARRIADERFVVLDYVDGFKNNTSLIACVCNSCSHEWTVRIANVLNGVGCPECAKRSVRHYGYFFNRIDELDYLYIISFDGLFLKIGRAFNVQRRLYGLRMQSGIQNLNVLAVYSGSHNIVWSLEQRLHRELNILGYKHVDSAWTNESFVNASFDFAIDFLNQSSLVEIK